MKRLVISLLLCTMVGVASANTCDRLEEMYRAKLFGETDWANQNHFLVGAYMGIVLGWIERDTMVDELKIIDYPKGWKYTHAEKIIGQWLQKHPEKWHLPYRDCIFLALHDAYGGKNLRKK